MRTPWLIVGSLAVVMVVPETHQEGFRAELVGAGVISRDEGDDVFPALTPDGNALYFSRPKGRNWSDQTIMFSRDTRDGWSEPEVAPFSGSQYSDRAPRFSADGNTLFFTTNRPLPGGTFSANDYNIWIVRRVSDGWSEPEPLSGSINTSNPEIHTSVTADGTLYFASARPDGHGRSDIYRAERRSHGYAAATNIGGPINTEQSQPDLYVGAAGQMMILAITDHPEGFGGDDLYVSYFRNGSWTTPRNLGPAVNTPEYEYGPTLSPDGEYLYFSSHRNGSGRIYRIRLAELGVEIE